MYHLLPAAMLYGTAAAAIRRAALTVSQLQVYRIRLLQAPRPAADT
jgi:hypothetical protein